MHVSRKNLPVPYQPIVTYSTGGDLASPLPSFSIFAAQYLATVLKYLAVVLPSVALSETL